MAQLGKISLLLFGSPGREKEHKEEFYGKRGGRSSRISLGPRTELLAGAEQRTGILGEKEGSILSVTYPKDEF